MPEPSGILWRFDKRSQELGADKLGAHLTGGSRADADAGSPPSPFPVHIPWWYSGETSKGSQPIPRTGADAGSSRSQEDGSQSHLDPRCRTCSLPQPSHVAASRVAASGHRNCCACIRKADWPRASAMVPAIPPDPVASSWLYSKRIPLYLQLTFSVWLTDADTDHRCHTFPKCQPKPISPCPDRVQHGRCHWAYS